MGSQRVSGRARLLESARRLFSKSGFHEVSVADLLDDSQLKAPSLYHHFGNKEGLYVAFVEASLRQLYDRLKVVASSSGSTEAKLRQAAFAILDGQRFDLLQVQRDLNLMSQSGHVHMVRSLIHDTIYCPMGRIFEQGIATEEVPADDPVRLSHLFIHSVYSLHTVYSLAGRPSPETYHWLVAKYVVK